ncbi:MAG: hypothetical protein ACD_7C00348G0007 [uncultured bacterium]|nr:MAG: hypothetical protein ACD_7C00348G0007 [uncultured bacterium]HBR79953.1 hypothetical protein [Candidatus Moranbacteria bacterium]
MNNKLFKFVKKNYYQGIFCLIFLLTTSFLFFQEGVWTYLDLSYEAGNLFGNELSFNKIFNNIATSTAFGYDNTQLLSTRFINIFLEIAVAKLFGNFFQIVYFFIYFGLSFILAKKCLSLVFEIKSSYLGALLYTFNPISLYLLNEAGFFFVYFSLPLIIYSTVKYFKEERAGYIYMLMFVLGISLLTSYVRVSFIYFGVAVVLALVFYKDVFYLIKLKKKKILILVSTSVLVFLPIMFSFICPHLLGDNKNFSGISNYSEAYVEFGDNIYDKQTNVDFFKGFVLTELTANFASKLQGNLFFIVFSGIYFLGGIIFSFFVSIKKNVSSDHRKLALFFLVIILGSIFFKNLAYFTNQSFFIKITYGYLPFLANNSLWVMLGFLTGFSGLLSFIFSYSNKKEKIIIVCTTFLYILLVNSSLFFYSDNVKLKTIAQNNVPDEYQIFSQQKRHIPTLFFPSRDVYFNWASYPINISQGGVFKEIFSSNVRLVNDKQVELSKNLYSPLDSGKLANLYFFNGKSIFVFKDVKNDNVGFDYFSKKNYTQLARDYYAQMKKEESFFLQEDNEHFAQFVFKNYSKADFFIYSPKVVLPMEVNDFFQQGPIDIGRRAVLLDVTSFNKPSHIQSEIISQNIKISAKLSENNITKHLVKIENVKRDKSFLIQLNQTFGMSWKIKWVNKDYFEEKKCSNGWENFEISNNAVCSMEGNFLDLKDIGLLFDSEVNSANHFEGNFVGNSWLVEPTDIPVSLQNEKELYAVIVYEKQIYYMLTLMIAGVTIIILIILSAKEFVCRKFLTE